MIDDLGSGVDWQEVASIGKGALGQVKGAHRSNLADQRSVEALRAPSGQVEDGVSPPATPCVVGLRLEGAFLLALRHAAVKRGCEASCRWHGLLVVSCAREVRGATYLIGRGTDSCVEGELLSGL